MSKHILLIAAVVLLAGCSEGKEAIGTIKDFGATASGAVQEAKGQVEGMIDQGKTAVEGVQEMIDDAKNRMNQVQSGMHMMMEGKDMIEGGIKGE